MEVNVSQIPTFQKEALADLAVRLTKECFEIPGMEEKYQKWLKERETKEGE